MEQATINPAREVIRAAIDLQVCPWCKRGPFRVLAQHTWLAHQVSASELRRMADYTAKVSICAPEHAVESKDRLMSRPDHAAMTARAAQAAKSVGALDEAHRVRAERWKREKEPIRKRIIELHEGRALIQQIADEVGVDRGTVARVLRSEGRALESAADRFRNGDYREQNGRQVRAAQAQRQADQSAQAAARVSEFRALGGDSTAVGIAANRWGITRKAALVFLRRHGVTVQR